MSGKYSRDKGRRAEYMVRDLLRAEGFSADRVPLSGAAQAYKGDIRFSKEGKTYLAEVKVRSKGVFKHVYAELEEQTKQGPIGISLSDGRACVVSRTAEMALINVDHYLHSSPKAGKQLGKIEEFVKGCDILVIKEDHKPFLFIRYL